MANVYTTKHSFTLAQRGAVYQQIADMFLHLDALGLTLQSLVLNADHTISITLSGPIRADHVGLWDLNNGV